MIVKPTIHEVLPLVKEVYERSMVGCCLHIVLDDFNCKDSHVKFCLDEARQHGHLDCIELAQKLMLMSITQRRALARAAGLYE